MSEDAEARAAELLSELRSATPPGGAELTQRVARSAQWQRPLRHVLISLGAAAGSAGQGLAYLVRRR